jgi:hypothetical protein
MVVPTWAAENVDGAAVTSTTSYKAVLAVFAVARAMLVVQGVVEGSSSKEVHTANTAMLVEVRI